MEIVAKAAKSSFAFWSFLEFFSEIFSVHAWLNPRNVESEDMEDRLYVGVHYNILVSFVYV